MNIMDIFYHWINWTSIWNILSCTEYLIFNIDSWQIWNEKKEEEKCPTDVISNSILAFSTLLSADGVSIRQRKQIDFDSLGTLSSLLNAQCVYDLRVKTNKQANIAFSFDIKCIYYHFDFNVFTHRYGCPIKN